MRPLSFLAILEREGGQPQSGWGGGEVAYGSRLRLSAAPIRLRNCMQQLLPGVAGVPPAIYELCQHAEGVQYHSPGWSAKRVTPGNEHS